MIGVPLVRASLLLQATDPFRLVGDLLGSPYVRAGFWLAVAFFAALALAVAYWVHADAVGRGAIGAVWGTLAVLLPLGGALIYLLVRPREHLAEKEEREALAREHDLLRAHLESDLKRKIELCPGCRAVTEGDYLCCPECGRELKKECEFCTRPLKKNWGFCPHCRSEQVGSRTRR